MHSIFPTAFTPTNTFRAVKVVNLETGEHIASFPFSLAKVHGEADCAAYAMIDRLEGNPPDPYIAAVFANSNALI